MLHIRNLVNDFSNPYMMNNSERNEELVNEIKALREAATALNGRITGLQYELHSKTAEIMDLRTSVQNLQSKVNLVQSEKQHIQKKCQNQIKKLEAEVKRNDLFQSKVMSTSKTKKEHFMIQEMDALRKVNKTLLGFADVLSQKFDFDRDLLKTLCEISSGTDDMVLSHFLDGLGKKIVSDDVPHNSIEVTDAK